MPSKLKKAIGTVKDQTSIGLAMVSKTATRSLSSHLDLVVLRSTTHDKLPVDDRLISDLLHLTSSSHATAAACVQAISRRIERTHNWTVALKCLHLIYLCLRDGGPYFPREAVSATHLFDLSGFHEESAGGNQWDYDAFNRMLALYLQERLSCFLLGKLQNRRPLTGPNPVSDLKPPAILDRIAHWQRLLGRAIATRPTGLAKNNMLVHVSFYLVVRESFVLYKDVSDGLALLLDSFFRLQRQTCVSAYQTCLRAARQFKELEGFYDACRAMAAGRRTEYPEVQKISDELLATLSDFIKSEKDMGTTRKDRVGLKMGKKTVSSESNEFKEGNKSGGGGQGRRSLPDLVSFGEEFDEDLKANQENSNPENGLVSDFVLFDEFTEGGLQNSEKKKQPIERSNYTVLENSGARELEDDGNKNNSVVPDLVAFDDYPEASTASCSNDWELVLAESASGMSSESNYGFSRVPEATGAIECPATGTSRSLVENRNPFLDDDGGNCTSLAVSSPATPTFSEGKFDETLISWLGTEPCSSSKQQMRLQQQCEVMASGYSTS